MAWSRSLGVFNDGFGFRFGGGLWLRRSRAIVLKGTHAHGFSNGESTYFAYHVKSPK